ncbi:MAG: extracellular solute-binding protein, partial [Anaerolineales bacterium]
MKKIYLVLSVLLVAGMVLTACGSQATATPVATEAPEEGASIVFSGWGDETEQQIYRDSIERFNALYPGVTVDYQPIPADFQTKLKAAMAGGTAPDVFYVDDQLMTAFGTTG